MEKKSRIITKDLPDFQSIGHDEMRKITGGWSIQIGKWRIGSLEGKSCLEGDFSYYVYDTEKDDASFY